MKAIIILLGLIALSSAAHLKSTHKSSSATMNTFMEDVNVSDLSDDVQDSLAWGYNQVIAAAVKAGKVSSGARWTLSKVLSANNVKTGTRTESHSFSVVLTSGSSTLSATYTVNFVTFSGYRTLTSYNYNVKTVTVTPAPTPVGSATDVDLSEDSDAEALYEWAVETIVNSGLAAHKIPADNYHNLDAELQSQRMTSGNQYIGTADLVNDRQTEVTISFTVYVAPNGQKTLTNSRFQATGIEQSASFNGRANIDF